VLPARCAFLHVPTLSLVLTAGMGVEVEVLPALAKGFLHLSLSSGLFLPLRTCPFENPTIYYMVHDKV
jgi:hypothetical protein